MVQLILLMLIGCGVAGLIGLEYGAGLQQLAIQVLDTKSDSIGHHATALEQLSQLTGWHLIGLNPTGITGESGYLNLVSNFGLIYLLVYLAMGAIAISRYYRLLLSPTSSFDTKAFASAAFLFLVSVHVALINLPFETIFPINLFSALFVGLATSNALKTA